MSLLQFSRFLMKPTGFLSSSPSILLSRFYHNKISLNNNYYSNGTLLSLNNNSIYTFSKRYFATSTIKVPYLGDSITEGTISEIRKNSSEIVAVDEVLATIETDKVSQEVRADTKGKLTQIHVKPGQNVKVGDILFSLDSDGAAAAPSSSVKSTPAPAPTSSQPTASSSSSSLSSSSAPIQPIDSHRSPLIKFVHGKGRNELGDFPNYPVHTTSTHSSDINSQSVAPSKSPSAAPPNALANKAAPLPPSAFFASDSNEWLKANEAAAKALKNLPLYYQRRPMSLKEQQSIDLGGAEYYEAKSKKASKE